MVKRSTPQREIDERAFPVRMLVCVPKIGFGVRTTAIHEWLSDQVGRADHAFHPAGRQHAGRDVVAVYFRNPAPAMAFLAAFPDMELADGTALPGYTSPYLQFGRQPEDEPVCNLYTQTRAQEAVRQLFAGKAFADRAGNLAPGDVYPDYLAPIVRHAAQGLELAKARWGMPSPQFVLKTARDPGVTNVRNTASPHWRRWLGPAHRCLVPFDRFAEPKPGGNAWFALADGRPAFFAGVEVRGWKSVRKIKDGETVDDLFAFLTCPPNREVGEIHPKAMPVILTEPEEWETWMGAPWEIAATLQRPLPDGSLVVC